MQILIPLAVQDLHAPTPPSEKRLVVAVPSDAEDYDQVSEDTREEASFLSLQAALDTEDIPTRLVLSAEVPADDAPLESWEDADSLYVDGKVGRELCRKAAAAATQEEADHALELLISQQLLWADTSERDRLYSHLVEGETWQ